MKAKKITNSTKPGKRFVIRDANSGKVIKTKKLGSGKRKKAFLNKKLQQEIVPHTLATPKVETGVSELLRIVKERNVSKTQLFDSEGHPVFLTLGCFRIANVAKRILRFVLPHSLVQDTTDVALIVRDLEPRKRRPDNDAVVQLYESRIFAHGIKHPIKVLPIRQVMTEYNTYESKKQLCNQFDIFLADSHICQRLTPILGKTFTTKRKNPVPVKLDGPLMKQSIERALCKTGLKLSADGGSFTVQVGHTLQTAQQIAENIDAVVKELCKDFPGGWNNIRNLVIKTGKSPAVPLYVAIRDPSAIKVTAKKLRLRHGSVAEGELSTKLNSKVKVLPSGKVTTVTEYKKLKRQEKLKRKEESDVSEDEEEDDELFDSDVEMSDDGEAELSEEDNTKQPLDTTAVEEDSDSDDPILDEAEDAYLNELDHQMKLAKAKKKAQEKVQETPKEKKGKKGKKVKKSKS